MKEQSSDYIYTGTQIPTFELPGTLGLICEAEVWENRNQVYPIFDFDDFINAKETSAELNFVRVYAHDLEKLKGIQSNAKFDQAVLVLNTENTHGTAEMRRFFIELMQLDLKIPIVLNRAYQDIDDETFQLHSSTDFGALFLDGMGDGIFIQTENGASPQLITTTSFGILQATRTRISKTEYISCPSCGRTLFDLQETTAKIRAKTSHLKGLKIGIMGCIVNGPGEMADADYGYVGVGKGKINFIQRKRSCKT